MIGQDKEASSTLKKFRDFDDEERHEASRTKMILDLLSQLQNKTGVGHTFEKILDIGCCLGTTLKALEKYGKCVGVDVQLAGKELHPDLDIRVHDLNSERLPFDDCEFDLVICTEVIEHTFYPKSILKEIKRVLKESGFAIISLPNSHFIYNRRDLLFGRHIAESGKFDSYGHHYFTSLKENIDFVKSEFKIIQIKYQWIDSGKASFICKIWKNPNLFAKSVMMLCRKSGSSPS